MYRSWRSAVLPCLVLAVAGWPDGAQAIEPDELAVPGVCATAARELRQGPLAAEASASENDAKQTATGAPRVHLTPVQVAATPPPFSGPRPPTPTFTGPGPCDQPGSGCRGPILPASQGPSFVDRTPAGGGGFPGGGKQRAPLP